MSLFVVLLTLLLASVVAGASYCGVGSVAVPKDTETFECLSVKELQHLQELERDKRFDAEAATRFMLWTQRTTNPEGNPEELIFNNLTALRNSSFDPRNPTRILIHGWLNDWTSQVIRGLSRAYVAKGAYNVIGIDWSAGAMNILYPVAQKRVGAVADAIAKQIALLLQAGQHPSQIVLVGHSLGAHVAGLTGKHFQTEPKLAAIFALDPAGPLFSENNPAARVDALDAVYVEVIHTSVMLGYMHALGQADFYPNGGKSQPGCILNACNHHKAVEYFQRSLTGSGPMYVGKRCEADAISDKCDGAQAVMGGDLSDIYKTKMSGQFYLTIGE
ncbi:lipase member H-like [Anopheles stephensi]|uniref:lipase member H-like n=1 Tax=Anopheles stephensi TaxID=30069 RepID=UPI001658A38E|nr:lipase member H-like [Anopheles stephensi]